MIFNSQLCIYNIRTTNEKLFSTNNFQFFNPKIKVNLYEEKNNSKADKSN